MLVVYLSAVVLYGYVVQASHQNSIGSDSSRSYPTCSISDCLPYINFREILHLTYFQKQQVNNYRAYLHGVHRRLLSAKEAAPKDGRHFIDITPDQRAKILAMYGNYFTLRDDLPIKNSVQKRDVHICPRVQSWNDLILRLTNDDQLIQVVQFDDNNRQWILEETCSQQTCTFVPQCACGTWTRYVKALVVNFDQTIIVEKYIKVYCCIARKTLTF